MDTDSRARIYGQLPLPRADLVSSSVASALAHDSSSALPFQALLEAAPDAIVITDRTGRITIVNSQVEQLFGYGRDEIIGQPVDLLLPEQLRHTHIHHRAAYLAEPRTRPMGSGLNLTARRKDGSTFPVEISLSALPTAKDLLITSVIRDISERQRTAAALRASEDRFVRIFRTTQVACVITRLADGRILDANESFLHQLGYGRDEVIGHTMVEVGMLPQREQYTRIEQMVCAQQSLHELETTFRTKAGALRDVLASLEVIDNNGDAGILMVFQDISERKRAAEELERQVQRRTAHLNALLQFSQELLVAADLDAMLQRALSHALTLVPEALRGAIYLYDEASVRLVLRASVGFTSPPELSQPPDVGLIGLAFTRRQAVVIRSAADWEALSRELPPEQTTHMLDALHLSQPPALIIALPLMAQADSVGVLLLLCSTGEGVSVNEALITLQGVSNLAAVAIREARSSHTKALLESQVTQLEAQQRALAERLTSAEASVVQAAKLAAVGQLAASLAHEINNPLYATRNSLYLLQRQLPAEHAGAEYLNMAREQLARIATLIERMRDFYRPSRDDMSMQNLNELLAETLSVASSQMRYGGIDVIFVPDSALPPIACNGDQLRQVFLNLILNAIDAMPEGGTLTVRSVAGPTVALAEVQDTGVGIPEELRARLFDPFFTTKPTGTGLGLAISGHIVLQHGGRIEVESRVGQGSLFRIALPLQSQ